MLHNSRPGKVYKFDFRSMGLRQLHRPRQTGCRGFGIYCEPVGLTTAGLQQSRCSMTARLQPPSPYEDREVERTCLYSLQAACEVYDCIKMRVHVCARDRAD